MSQLLYRENSRFSRSGRFLTGFCTGAALIFGFARVGNAGVPAVASASGYTMNTFSSSFSSSTLDQANTARPGFLWYPWNLFSHHTSLQAIVLNPDQSVTLGGDTTGPNGEITTATPPPTRGGQWTGTAFGGGAYIEAEIKFNPDDEERMQGKGWPSFWALPIEDSVLPNPSQWPGQAAGYKHSVETDFLEYLYLPSNNVPRNVYGAGMHDWYGIPHVTCPNKGLCVQHMQSSESKRPAPLGTDFTKYHKYGFLWIVAKEGAPGHASFYFDGQMVGPDRRWTQFTNQPPPPNDQPWAFGRLDQQHMVLILGTGLQEPMTVRSVNVWQRDASQNLKQ